MTILFAILAFAPPQAAQPRGPGFIFILQMAAFVAIIYFLMIRPRAQQEKRHRARLKDLRRGDEVVTAGGVIGKIVHLKDDEITIKSGDTRLEIIRDRIAEVRTPGEKEEKKS